MGGRGQREHLLHHFFSVEEIGCPIVDRARATLKLLIPGGLPLLIRQHVPAQVVLERPEEPFGQLAPVLFGEGERLLEDLIGRGHGGQLSADLLAEGREKPDLPAQNWFQRYWLVTSWWNWISLVFTRLPRALGQRSAEAFLSSANLLCTASPKICLANGEALKRRMAS